MDSGNHPDSEDILNMITVISTIPHYIAAVYAPNLFYASIVCISSTLSIVWHLKKEPYGILCNLDYLFAGLWIVIEILYTTNIYVTIFANVSVFAMNKITDKLTPYETYHSAWHILSIAKSILIAKVYT